MKETVAYWRQYTSHLRYTLREVYDTLTCEVACILHSAACSLIRVASLSQ